VEETLNFEEHADDVASAEKQKEGTRTNDVASPKKDGTSPLVKHKSGLESAEDLPSLGRQEQETPREDEGEDGAVEPSKTSATTDGKGPDHTT
jgi:hypothetical protein